MGKPFSDILEAERIYRDFQNYKAYKEVQGTEGYSNVGTLGKRGTSAKIYIVPFAFDIPANTYLESSAKPEAWDTLQTHVNGVAGVAVKNTVAADSGRKVKGFTPAKVVWHRNNTYSTQTPTSRFTKRKYLKYIGPRYTLPFGRDDENSTVDQQDAFNAIRSVLLAITEFNQGFNRANWLREKSAL